MNKKLILILLVGLVFVAGLTFVYAKHISKEGIAPKPHPRAIQSVETVPMERVRTGTLSEKPKSIDDLKGAALNAGKPYISPEDQMKTDLDVGVIKIATPAGMIDESALTECVINVHNDPCCYWQPWPDYFDQYLNCVGTAEYWQLQDAQLNPENSACGYPIYPFEVASVEFFINTPAPCTLEVEFAVTWDYGTSAGWGFPFPFYPAPDYSSGIVTIFLPEAGSYYVYHAIPDSLRPCYHTPFFARFWLMNSDDFTDGDPPVYCDSARYGFWLSGVFDGGGVTNQGYYYSDAYGGYYDIVDIKGGNMRLYADGFTRDQNECELESLWYHKPSYGEWECTEPVEEHLDSCIVYIDTTNGIDTTWGSWRLVFPVDYGYAPDGMPDFNQYQFEVPAFCGPTALANCLWWTFSGGFPWFAISNWYGAWDPSIPPLLIAELAACMNTDPNFGTDVYDMQQCVLDLNETYGFWLTETTIVQPTFDDIEYQVRLSQDVILLLGFWYFDEELEIWYRIGGHYVTISGVNWEFFLLSFSDPAWNDVCDWGSPGDSSGGVFIPHAEPFCDPPCHNDAGNVSHDYYAIALNSPSPGGILWIPGYEVPPEAFFQQNVPPEFAAQQSEIPTPQYPVVTEIEFAVVICPGSPFVTHWLDSWNVAMVKTNYGGEGPGYLTWFDGGTDQLWEGTILLGQDGSNLGMGATAAGENISFFPYMGLECEDHFLWGTSVDPSDSMYLDTCYAKYAHTAGLDLDVEMFGIGFDPWGDSPNNCIGRPCEDMILQKFVITNTGESTIDSLEWALFADWDVNLPSPNTSFGGGDSLHNTGWAYDSTEESIILLTTLLPSSPGKIAPSWNIGDQNTYFYPDLPSGPFDLLKDEMEKPYWVLPDKVPANAGVFDYGYLMTSENFSLAPGEKTLQEYIIWFDSQLPDTDYPAYLCKLYRMMRVAGYYRGDVGDFATAEGSPGVCDVTDIVYIVNYVLKNGPRPWPFADQGDVDCTGITDIADAVYLVNWILRTTGPPPIDKNRFFPDEYKTLFSRPSLFVDPQWGVICPP